MNDFIKPKFWTNQPVKKFVGRDPDQITMILENGPSFQADHIASTKYFGFLSGQDRFRSGSGWVFIGFYRVQVIILLSSFWVAKPN